MTLQDLVTIVGVLIGFLGVVFGIYQYCRRIKDEQRKTRVIHQEAKVIKEEEDREHIKSAEQEYRAALRQMEKKMLNKYEIEIPDQVVHALGLLDRDVVNTIKKELAVYFFQRNALPFGQARQLSTLIEKEIIG